MLCGVPQGSILGPDLLLCGLVLTPRLYADDTWLTLTTDDPSDLQSKLNNDPGKIQSWLQAYKLSLNVKKTKYSITANQYEIAQLNHLPNIKMDGYPIGKVSLTSPIVINVPTRASLAEKTKVLLFLWLENLNNKSNVCKRMIYFLYTV